VASPPPHALFLSFCGLALLGVAGWLGGELVTRFGVGVADGANVDAPSTGEELARGASDALGGRRRGTTPLSSSLAEHRSK
jgi:hypothetical protein